MSPLFKRPEFSEKKLEGFSLLNSLRPVESEEADIPKYGGFFSSDSQRKEDVEMSTKPSKNSPYMFAENPFTLRKSHPEDVEMQHDDGFDLECISPAANISPMPKIEKSGEASKYNSFNEYNSVFVRHALFNKDTTSSTDFLKAGSPAGIT